MLSGWAVATCHSSGNLAHARLLYSWQGSSPLRWNIKHCLIVAGTRLICREVRLQEDGVTTADRTSFVGKTYALKLGSKGQCSGSYNLLTFRQ